MIRTALDVVTRALGIERCYRRRCRRHRVLLLGLEGAGKTTFLRRLLLLLRADAPSTTATPPPTVAPTDGFSLHDLEWGHVALTLWDFGGRGLFEPLWAHYFWDTHAVVFVVDASAPRERLHEAHAALQMLLARDQLPGTRRWLIVANKADRPGAIPGTELHAAWALGAVADGGDGERAFVVFDTVATLGTGVGEAMNWLVEGDI